MSLAAIKTMLILRKINLFNIINTHRCYAKAATSSTRKATLIHFIENYFKLFLAAVKSLGKKLVKSVQSNVVEKKIMPVESDPHKLVTQVCGSNYFVQGEDVKVRNFFLIVIQ